MKRLRDYSDKTIYLVSPRKVYVSLMFNPVKDCSDLYPLGSLGALTTIAKHSGQTIFYFLECHSIVFINPNMLINELQGCIAIVTKPYLEYETVQLRQDRILRIKDRPILNEYVLTGHYFFTKDFILKNLGDYGDLKQELVKICRKVPIYCYRYKGKWVNIRRKEDLYLLDNLTV